jgi:hypothetical protein
MADLAGQVQAQIRGLRQAEAKLADPSRLIPASNEQVAAELGVSTKALSELRGGRRERSCTLGSRA